MQRLGLEIAEELKLILETEDVAVLIDAVHLCVASRGVKDMSSSTVTAEYAGAFTVADIKGNFTNTSDFKNSLLTFTGIPGFEATTAKRGGFFYLFLQLVTQLIIKE